MGFSKSLSLLPRASLPGDARSKSLQGPPVRLGVNQEEPAKSQGSLSVQLCLPSPLSPPHLSHHILQSMSTSPPEKQTAISLAFMLTLQLQSTGCTERQDGGGEVRCGGAHIWKAGRAREKPPVSRSTRKELRSHHSLLTRKSCPDGRCNNSAWVWKGGESTGQTAAPKIGETKTGGSRHDSPTRVEPGERSLGSGAAHGNLRWAGLEKLNSAADHVLAAEAPGEACGRGAPAMQAHLVSLHFTDVVVLQIEGQPLHQQNDCSYTHFTAVALATPAVPPR